MDANALEGQTASLCQISWRSVKPSLRYGDFSKMATVRHRGFVMRILRPPAKGIRYRWSLSVQNLVRMATVVSIICKVWLICCGLDLKTPNHAPKLFFGRGTEIEKGWCDVDPNELVLTFGGCYLCATFGENRSRNATVRVRTDKQTHALTETNWIYNLSHAICCSYGGDNDWNSSVIKWIYVQKCISYKCLTSGQSNLT